MSSKKKLLERFLSQPKDFSFDELIAMMQHLGYSLNNKGKTSGSRVEFESRDDSFVIHKPHPDNTMKGYQMKQILDYLKQQNKL
jgi:hypothetical protein